MTVNIWLGVYSCAEKCPKTILHSTTSVIRNKRERERELQMFRERKSRVTYADECMGERTFNALP